MNDDLLEHSNYKLEEYLCINLIIIQIHADLDMKNMVRIGSKVEGVKIVFKSQVKLTIIPCKNVASNLRTSIYEVEHFIKGKSKLCDYLCQRFYNDGVHGIQERRVIWDISVIAYMINREWFETNEVSCSNVNNDTSYELTEGNHKITVVNYLNVDKIYRDLFKKLGE